MGIVEGKGNTERLTYKTNGKYMNTVVEQAPPYAIDCDIDTAITKLAEYENLEEQKKLLTLPCAVGDTVYVLTECEHIPKRLDGTLYGTNGEIGTATGYYCPYEDNCPLEDEDFDDCEKYKEKTSVFEDTVGDITVGEDGVWIRTSNCSVCSQIGVYIFLTQEEAEVALKELSEK